MTSIPHATRDSASDRPAIGDERLAALNNFDDIDIHCRDLRDEIRALLVRYRNARRLRLAARARLNFLEFLASVEATFGDHIAADVRAHAQWMGVGRGD